MLVLVVFAEISVIILLFCSCANTGNGGSAERIERKSRSIGVTRPTGCFAKRYANMGSSALERNRCYHYLIWILFYDFLSEHLERAVLAERAKVASQVHKLDELRQLLHDKTLTVDSLRRQLENSGSGGGSHASNAHHAVNASSQRASKDPHNQSQQRAHLSMTDQRAVDFLRRNGNFAGKCACCLDFCKCSRSLRETLSFSCRNCISTRCFERYMNVTVSSTH